MFLPGRKWLAWIFFFIVAGYAFMLYVEHRKDVRAIRLIQQGRGKEAVALVDELRADKPNYNGALVLRGLAHLQTYDVRAARADFGLLREQTANTVTDTDRAILDCYNTLSLLLDGDLHGALSLAQQGHDLPRPVPVYLAIKSLAHFAAGDSAVAIQYIDAAIERSPALIMFTYQDIYNPGSLLVITRPEYLYTLRALIQCDLGEYDLSIKDADFAIQKKPEYALAYLCRGYAQALSNQPERSQRSFDLFLEAQGSDDELWVHSASQGINLKEILIPALCLSLHRWRADAIIYNPERIQSAQSAQMKDQARFPRNATPMARYQPSPADEREHLYYSRDSRGRLVTLLGFGYLLVGLIAWLTKRQIASIRRPWNVGWKEVRVARDRWDGDMFNHLFISAGVVLIGVASMRIELSIGIVVVAGIGLSVGLIRLAVVLRRNHALKD